MVEDKIGEIKLNIISLIIISIIILGFFIVSSVTADQTVGTTVSGGVAFYALEDVTQVFNITINDTDAIASNITEVNITLDSALVFDSTSNGTSNATLFTIFPSNFTNTTTVLIWKNASAIFAGKNKSLFWFNATAATPGHYNITVTTLNDTGSYSTAMTVLVNDTNAPGVVIISPTINNSNLSVSAITFHINVTDNALITNCSYTLNNGVKNNTLLNNSAYTLGNTTAVDFSGTNVSAADGTYEVRFFCRDTSNNLNYSERRTFNIDMTAPRITITEPGNSSYDRNLRFNITGDTNMSFCKMSIDNWATNLTMTKKVSAVTNTSFNLTYFNIPSASYTARFWCNDSAGNINRTASVNFAVSYFNFNGTIYDTSGVAVNNTNITITIQDNSWSQMWYNSTVSNLSGWFNFTLPGNVSWMYQVSIKHVNYTSNFVDKVGQSIPLFPYREFATLSSPKFYLRDAGTINISVINSSAHNTNFSYFIKDAKLGFPITDCISNGRKNNTICYVPKNRNYTIMIYPAPGSGNFVPVTFEWTNFSSSASHNITSGGLNISFYNATTGVVTKVFNVTQSVVSITGYTKNSSGDNFTGWDEFTIVPFLAEGSKNYISKSYGILPYNASAFRAGGNSSDSYNGTSGYYNITLPYAPAETTRYILFAAVKNYSAKSSGLSAGDFGGYKNITVSTALSGFNFTMYGLLGSNSSKINMTAGTTTNKRTVNTTMFRFKLVNNTNDSLSSISANVEVTLNYSAYGAIQFIFMEQISQNGAASFDLPLLNVSGVEGMEIYSMNYAPKRIDKRTALQINTTENISLNTFNPQALDGTTGASISIALYMSNSTCDVPNPNANCKLTSSSNMASFSPLSAVIGGGKISFRMGMGGVLVHYVNVDMMASGPPDALFEDNNDITETGTSTGFSKLMRFGSQGPTIYDYILISLPYTQGSSSTTGLDEDSQVNISIPVFYDENWNIIWNSSSNGTNGTVLAGNYSHYATYKDDWSILMRADNNCTTNASIINKTNVCYIDKTNNRIWIRLPHFSGTGPSIDGTAVVATSSGTTVSGGGGGGGTAAYWTKTFFVGDDELEEGKSVSVAKKERFRVTLVNPSSGNRENHYVGVVGLTSNTITINVSSTPQQATLKIGDERKFDVTEDGYYDLRVKLNSITDDIANLTVKKISEKVTPVSEGEEKKKEIKAEEKKQADIEKKRNFIWLWILIGLVVVVVGIIIYWMMGKGSGNVKKNSLKVKK